MRARLSVAVMAAAVLSSCGTHTWDVAPTPESSAAPTPEPTQDASTVSESSSPPRVSQPLLVVNRDGSATLAAYLDNSSDADTAVVGVAILAGEEELTVLSTEVLMPLPADLEMRVGDATDAGGFVVPDGVEVGGSYRVVFGFDDGTCAVVMADAVTRAKEHGWVYPKRKSFPGAVPSSPGADSTCHEG